MGEIVSTFGFSLNKLCRFSSSVAKNGNSYVNGRSASIFKIDTDYCINP
jgi:hypothetical protein